MKKIEIKKQTVKQYADEKGVTVGAVYKAIREKRVKYEKLGNFYIILN